MTIGHNDVHWRASGPYLSTSAAKPALLEETRQFLLAYARTGDVADARRQLVSADLPQRSIYSRTTFAKIIRMRLAAWNPPAWVLRDLVSFAEDVHQPSLPSALLLHLARQDMLLYDLVQRVIVPRWESGERTVVRGDVQRFLDDSEVDHPEIGGWSHATREKLAGNALTLLRNHGLMRGSPHSRQQKQIVEPVVPGPVARHLRRLLSAEGLGTEEIVDHPDWRLWLWDGRRARAVVAAATVGEALV